MTASVCDWTTDAFTVIRDHDLSLVTHVPDAAHAPLIERCEECESMNVVGLTTEEEGVGLLAGAWAGGRKGILLMQSSGVGNCVNAFSLVATCRIPLLVLVAMRGEWGELIPWQVPMGKGVSKVLGAMGIHVLRVDSPEEVGVTIEAASNMAFNTRQGVAVLLSQRLIGAKQFDEEQESC